MYTNKAKIGVLLNKSESRPSPELSCFCKSFVDELFDEFRSDAYFWDHSWFNLYTRNYKEFTQKIKDEYNVTLDINDVPTLLIHNWRYNKKLIDYIKKRKNQYIINGTNDKIMIVHVDYDDYESHQINYGNGGQEILCGKINYKEIIQDMQKMILPHFHDNNHLEEYFGCNNVNKYTYQCFKKYLVYNDEEPEYWDIYRGNYDKKILDFELQEDYY